VQAREENKMNEKQQGFLNKMQKSKPHLYFKLINENRKLYNSLCRECQVKTVQQGGKIKPGNYCESCKNKAEYRVKRIQEIIEKAGGKVK
jgi:hypothetical protein